MSADLKRTQHYRVKGRDVQAVQRALYRTKERLYPHKKPSKRFGKDTVNAVRKLQHKHGILVTGIYGEQEHRILTKTKAWDGYCDWLMSHAKVHTTSNRDLVVSAFTYVYHHAPLPYSMGPDRDDWLEGEKVLPNYPKSSDCSATYEWCYWVRGLPQPSSFDWNVVGYTGSMVDHGQPVSYNDVRPGDAMFFGGTASVPEHVAMYVGHNKVLSRGMAGGPNLYDLSAYRTDYNQSRSYL